MDYHDYNTIEHVVRCVPHQYTCVMSVVSIAKLAYENKLTKELWYRKDGMVFGSDLDFRAIGPNSILCQPISQQIQQKSYYMIPITLALISEDGDLVYDEEAERLMWKGMFITIDGRLRIAACMESLASSTDEMSSQLDNVFFPVTIYHVDYEGLYDLLIQIHDEAKVKNVLSMAMRKREALRVLKYIRDPENQLDAELCQNINADEQTTTRFRPVDIVNVVDYMYADEIRKDETAVGRWLVQFLNEIADIFKDDVADIRASSKIRSVFRRGTIVWLIVLSKVIYALPRRKHSNWQDILRKTLQLDWTLESGTIINQVPLAHTITENTFKDYKEFFENRVLEVLKRG